MKVNRFVVYLAKDGWRWHLKRPNGRIIAESGEAYSRRQDALRAIRTVTRVVIWESPRVDYQ